MIDLYFRRGWKEWERTMKEEGGGADDEKGQGSRGEWGYVDNMYVRYMSTGLRV